MNFSKKTSSNKKRIIITIVGLIVVIAILVGIKGMQFGTLMAQGAAFSPPPESISTAVADLQSWESAITAIGSFDAVRGVTVAAEVPGRVVGINFEAGAPVKAGDLLLQQDISTETANLRAAQANATLTKTNLDRSRDLLSQRLISQSEYDAAEAQYQAAIAEVESIKTLIEKKTIRAPFSGRLGIRLVNLGENLQEGEEIVSLQLLDPLFINFHIQQRQLADIRLGYVVRATTDALPGQVIEGKITAINSEVDALTRNVRVQATASNPEEKVLPGMFANVAVMLPGERQVLTIPITAVLYAPYGDSVFVVEEQRNEQSGETQLVVRQQFVQLGETQGDYIVVESGLEQGDVVASTGVFKLRNGQAVIVNNKLAPDYKLNPEPDNA
ncbi:MAG TPA: efflux RND transporter periplasmic adaptor subunit [Gammaproteobacteria bacterium]